MDTLDIVSNLVPYLGVIWLTLIMIGICFWVAGK